MRTVAFSDPKIVKLLGEKFVCAWVNRRPDLKFKDGLYGAGWKPRCLSNGAAATNVTSVFADPDGTIVHAIPGYLDVAGFTRHLQFAQDLRARLYDPAVKREDRAKRYESAHQDAAKSAKEENEGEAHAMLAPRILRVNDFKFDFFDALGNVFR